MADAAASHTGRAGWPPPVRPWHRWCTKGSRSHISALVLDLGVDVVKGGRHIDCWGEAVSVVSRYCRHA